MTESANDGNGDLVHLSQEAALAAEQFRAAMLNLVESHEHVRGLALEVQERVAAIETLGHQAETLRSQLRAVMTDLPDSADLTSLDDLLLAWMQKPTDLLIVVKLTEQAAQLAEIVRALREMQRLLAVP